MDFEDQDGFGEGQEVGVAEIISGDAAPGGQGIGGDGDDGILTGAPCVDLCGVVGGDFAELQEDGRVGGISESELGIRVGEAKGIEVGFRVIGNELANAECVEAAEGILDAGIISASGKGIDDAPEEVGVSAKDEGLGVIGDGDAVEGGEIGRASCRGRV